MDTSVSSIDKSFLGAASAAWSGQMIVRIRMPESSRKPLKEEIEVEIRGPCDTGSIVTTATGFVLGTISRVLPLGGIEIEVEPSVYEKYRREGWKDAY